MHDHYGQTKKQDEDLPLFSWVEEDRLPEPPEEEPHQLNPQNDLPTRRDEEAAMILAYLKKNAVGRDNAVRGNQIVAALSLGNTQTLRDRVQVLRMEGQPVCATLSDGYFIWTSIEELKDFIAHYIGRAASQIECLNAMLAHARVSRGYPADELGKVSIVWTGHPELPANIHD